MPVKITIIPEGGLCNRMRAIKAAQHLCHAIKAPLDVAWIMNDELNCPYEHLFMGGDYKLKNRSSLHLPALISRLKRKSSVVKPIISFVERIFDIQIIDSKELLALKQRLTPEQLLSHVGCRRRTYLCAWFGFFGDDDFTGFAPSVAVGQMLEQMTEKFDDSTIGVHIRRTDNAIAIASSPLELFIEEIAAYPLHTTFFLATDSDQVKQTLATRFPNQIIIARGELSRTTSSGMVQATAELFALSGCRLLLASHWSSFSDAAAQIGQIPKVVVQKR